MANRFLSNITINDSYTFPSADGANGQVIGTDGAGNLSFVDQTTEALTLNITVKNKSGVSLAKGTIVHAHPSANPPSGNVVEVIAADYDTSAKMPAIGVLNETLANEAEGQAIMFGAVSGIDTSSFSAGDELWVGNNGAFTNTKPATAGQLIQKIAVVIKSHASNGLIKIFGAGRTNDVPLPLYIDNTNQRVGIGVPLPTEALDIEGSVKIGNLKIQNANGGRIGFNRNTATGAIYNSSYGAYQLQHNFAGYLELQSYNSAGTFQNNLVFTEDGDLGIGITPSSGYKLDVAGSIRTNSNLVANNVYSGSGTFVFGLSTSLGEYITSVGNDIRFYAGGSAVATIDGDNSRVGIGTTTPSAELHVKGAGEVIRLQGDTGQSYMTFYQGTGGRVGYIGTSGTGMVLESADHLHFYSGGSSTMYLDSNSNVGIGTTSPQAGKRLDVRSDASISGSQAIAGYGYNETSTAILGQGYATSGTGTNYGIRGVSNGPRTGGVNVAGHFSADGAGTNYALITGNGNVGINTSSPSYLFEVNTSSVSTYVAHFTRNGASLGGMYVDSISNGEFYVKASGNNTTVLLNSSGSSYLNGGNVGIGTSFPQEKLQVNGNLQLGDNPTIYWTSNNLSLATKSNAIPVLNLNGSTSYDPRFDVWNAGNTTVVNRINSNGFSWFNGGNVGIGTSGPGTKLDVVSNSQQLRLRRTDGLDDDWRFYSWASGLNIFPQTQSTVFFGRDGATTDVNVYNGNLIVQSGALKGPSTFYIDPSPDDTGEPGGATTDTGTVVILGDLQVTGTTTTIDSTTLNVGDKNIVLAKDAAQASEANGAGITIETGTNNPVVTDATLLYNSTNDTWDFNKWVTASRFVGDLTGTVTGSSSLNVLKSGDTMTGNLNLDGTATINQRNNTSGDAAIIKDINWLTSATEGSDDRAGIIRVRTQAGTSTTRGGKMSLYVRAANSSSFRETRFEQDGNWYFPNRIEAAGQISTAGGSSNDILTQYVSIKDITSTDDYVLRFQNSGGSQTGYIGKISTFSGFTYQNSNGHKFNNNVVLAAGADAYGNIDFSNDETGLTWSRNTDGASIKFYNTGDGDTNSRLEFQTTDNNNEYFRWTHYPSSGTTYELMRLTGSTNSNGQLLVNGSVGVTNIVTNKVVKFNGSILDDSNITDTGSLITLGSATNVDGELKLLAGRTYSQFNATNTNNRLTFNQNSGGYPRIYNYDTANGSFHEIVIGGGNNETSGLLINAGLNPEVTVFNGLDINGGVLKFGGNTVIDASRNVTAINGTFTGDVDVDGILYSNEWRYSNSWRKKKFVRSVGVSGGDIAGKWVHLLTMTIDGGYEKAKIKFTIDSADDVAHGREMIDVLYENSNTAQENHQCKWYAGDDLPNIFDRVKSIRTSSSGLNNTYQVWVRMAGDWRDTFTVEAEMWIGADNNPVFPTTAGTATEPSGDNDINNTSRSSNNTLYVNRSGDTMFGSLGMGLSEIYWGGADDYNASATYVDNGSGDHYLVLRTKHAGTNNDTLKLHAQTKLATFSGGITSAGGITSGGIGEFAGAIRITETGTAQNILIGNQDSAGVNNPAMIQGVNGSLRFGHGSSWSGEGGTFTEKMILTSSGLSVTGTISSSSTITATTFSGSFSGNGSNITNVNADTVDGIQGANIRTVNSEYSATISSDGWYTIAEYGSGRAQGEFYVFDTNSSRHNYVRLLVTWSYGHGGIVCIENGKHGVLTIKHARLLFNTSDQTYGGCKLQIYGELNGANWTMRVRQAPSMFSGWGGFTQVSPTLANTVTNFAEYSRASDLALNGGISTSGSTWYAGGNKVWHAGNSAFTSNGLGANFTDPVTIYDNNISENPRLSVGRSSSQNLRLSVGDRDSYITHLQDESDGTHTMYSTIDSPAPDKVFFWQARAADGSSPSQFLRLDSNGLLADSYRVNGSTNNGKINGSGDWGVKVTTDSGYIHFGPANTGHAHIYTDRANFYFNKELLVNNNAVVHQGMIPSWSAINVTSSSDATGIYLRNSDEVISGEAWATAFYAINNNDGWLFVGRDSSSNPHPIFHIGGLNNASHGGFDGQDSILTLTRTDGTKNTGSSYSYRGLSNSSYYTNIIKTTTGTVLKDAQGVHKFYGDIYLDGEPTTTNQDRKIVFTGFDKEGTTDFSDEALIRHTSNHGGITGSVLEIKSMNDANDGIVFTTNGGSQLKHNGSVILTDANKGSYITQTYVNNLNVDADTLDGISSGDFHKNNQEHLYLYNKIQYSSGSTSTVGNNTLAFHSIAGAGAVIHADEEFKDGFNNVSIYNNAGGTALTYARIDDSTAPNNSRKILRFTYNGGSNGTTPGYGGFYFAVGTAANRVIICRWRAKLGSGKQFNFASNSYGSGGHQRWLTSNVGTGKWEEYASMVICGSSGTFSSTHFYYITGGTSDFDLASAACYDVTNTSDKVARYYFSENMYAQKFVDRSNNSYYLDPSSWSNLASLDFGLEGTSRNGQVAISMGDGSLHFRSRTDFNHKMWYYDGVAFSTNPSHGHFRFYGDSVQRNNSTAGSYLKFDIDVQNSIVTTYGELRSTGDVIAYSSDERLKTNIKQIPDAIEKVKALKGVTYDWVENIEDLGFKPRNKKDDVGLIAQDLEKVLPQVVAPAPFDHEMNDETGEMVSKSGEEYKTVQYDKVVPLLIEAIKEQQKQIDELKAIINKK